MSLQGSTFLPDEIDIGILPKRSDGATRAPAGAGETICCAGIDPGLSGAIAFYRPNDLIRVFDLPVVSSVIDGRNLVTLIAEFAPTHVVIEDVHSMPKQGVASTFKFGRAFGTTIGVIEALGLCVSYAAPTKWKRHYGLNSEAEKSRRAALNLFPGAAGSFARKKDHNRAEAALLAHYGATVVFAARASEAA